MKKKKIKSLGVNIIAPGIGQFFLKRFIRGFVMLLGAFALCIWAFWILFQPFVAFACSSSGNDEIVGINFIKLILAMVSVVLIWGWSYLDIIIFPPEEDAPVEVVGE